MNLTAEAPLWLALAFGLLLTAAAVEDAVRMRISNLTCALVLATAIVAMTVVGVEWRVWQNFSLFTTILALGMLLFTTGKMGGGDVKLFAAAGLWFDLQGGLLMLICVLLFGGVLALLILATRMIGWSESTLHRVQALRARAGIPYGVAIAVGALIAAAVLRSYSVGA